MCATPPWAAPEYDARCSFLAKLMAVASPDLSTDAEKTAGKLQRSAASSVIAREWRSHRASTQEGGKRTSSCDEPCAPDASMPEGAAEPTGVDSTSLCGLSRSITADGRSIWCFRQDAADLTSDGRSTQTPATEGEAQTPKTEGAAGDPRTEAVDRAQPSRSIGLATPAVQPPQQQTPPQTDAEMDAEMPPLTPLSFSAGLVHDEAGYETGRIGKEVDVAMTSKMYENLLFPLPPVMEASPPPVGEAPPSAPCSPPGTDSPPDDNGPSLLGHISAADGRAATVAFAAELADALTAMEAVKSGATSLGPRHARNM